jgi:hypothetical protein
MSNRQLTGMRGVYLVAAELSGRGLAGDDWTGVYVRVAKLGDPVVLTLLPPIQTLPAHESREDDRTGSEDSDKSLHSFSENRLSNRSFTRNTFEHGGSRFYQTNK